MNINELLAAFLKANGCSFKMGERTLYGIFTPKDAKEAEFLHKRAGELGKAINGEYILITLPVEELTKNSRLSWRGESYLAAAVEDYYLGDSPLYRYAVLQRCATEDEV